MGLAVKFKSMRERFGGGQRQAPDNQSAQEPQKPESAGLKGFDAYYRASSDALARMKADPDMTAMALLNQNQRMLDAYQSSQSVQAPKSPGRMDVGRLAGLFPSGSASGRDHDGYEF